VACAIVLVSTLCAAQVSVTELATAPADAAQFTILSAAGQHGTTRHWTGTDGRLMARMSLNLRGQIWEQDEATQLGADGAIADYRLRGVSPQGDVDESFRIANGTANWKSSIDSGAALYEGPAFYTTAGWNIPAGDVLIERLVAHPDRELALLPAGKAHIDKLTTLDVTDGAARQKVTAWAVSGISGTPFPVWTDARGKVFAWIDSLSIIRKGYESSIVAMQKAQDVALAARSPILARQLARVASRTTAFVDVLAFVDGSRFDENQTVLVSGGRIVAVGPAANISIPPGATITPGAGKTLVPGLWDCHLHVSDDYTGPSELSLGVTSIRDPGNVVALTKARRERRASDQLLFPHVYASTLIDGKGPYAAQLGVAVESREEALAEVRKAKADGHTGVKFYGTMDRSWLAPAAAEARRLNLHIHGHVPAGMRPRDAIEAGYEEITHINFVAMQAMPDDVVAHSNSIQRFQGTGRYAKDLNFDTEPMKSLITLMAERKVWVDPTLVAFEGIFVPESGDLSPAYAPYVGTLPPAVERGFRQGGFKPEGGASRTDFRASFRKLIELVGRLHWAGVPIVAGTDGSGLELVRELELYVEAGFTPAEAIASATILPARLVGVQDQTGSIAVGKRADLALVDGDPSRKIGDLRHVLTVMMDGKIMQADKLRAAVGVSARPAYEIFE
jgi:cytosine/adenosine deaminase-related metal-dependent hydrolase